MRLSKKGKLVVSLLVLLLLVIICFRLLSFKTVNYRLNTEKSFVDVKEVFDKHYYIEIKTKNNIYPIRIYKDFNKRKIVKKVYLYNDKNIECILPIISNYSSNVMCFKEGILYDYQNIVSQNDKLDKYISTIKEYDVDKYNTEYEEYRRVGTVSYNKVKDFNKKNVITTYKGLINNGKEIVLFRNDIYNNDISIFVNNYYLVADYMDKHTFNYFYVVNLDDNSVSKLKYKEEISYDSYIQGIVDNKVYLYDKNSEVQYEIDVENLKIEVVSDNDYIKYYSNGKWSKLSKTKANRVIYFDYETLDNIFTDYDYVKETKDYYYLFKKNGAVYNLYRVDKNRLDIYKFITSVPVTNVIFNDNYLYYIYKNRLYYYGDEDGKVIVLENSELSFNDTIKYYIY